MTNTEYKRLKYRRVCNCESSPKYLKAPPPLKVIPGGKYLDSIWIFALLQKYEFGMPLNRLIDFFYSHSAKVAAGTLSDGLKTLCGLLEAIHDAILKKLFDSAHVHIDETGWRVLGVDAKETPLQQ